MADEMRLQAPIIDQNIKINISGMNKLQELGAELNRIQKSFEGVNSAAKNFSEVTKSLRAIRSSGNSSPINIAGGISTAGAKSAVSDIRNISAAIREYYRLLGQPAVMNGLVSKDTKGVYTTQKAEYESLVNTLNRLSAEFNNLTAAENLNKLSTIDRASVLNTLTQYETRYTNAIERQRNEAQKMRAGSAEYANAIHNLEVKTTQAENALRKFTAAQSSNNVKSKNAYEAIQRQVTEYKILKTQLENNELSQADFNARIASANAEVAANTRIIRENGDAHVTMGQRVSAAMSKFSQWFSVTSMIMLAVQAVRKMISCVIDLDTAMTELRKVTDETEYTYDRFLENAVLRARKLGATLTDTVSATAEFAKLGYSLEDAEEISDAAIVYKNVGDGIESISDASESIISTMKAFGIEANDALLIVDKFNEVGNNFSISSKGVGDALIRSASAMHTANNSLDETIALITAANTIVQNPDSVGTTMKTLSMYLRAAKTEAEEAGESTEGMANSVSELRNEILSLTSGKVDIQIDEDTFKSTYQILKELSEVWDELDDISHANILEMIGGKRNGNVVSALLENFDIAEQVLKASGQAEGSALEENEKFLNSIQGHISQLKIAFQDLAQNLFNEDLIKGFIDFLTLLANAANGIATVINALGGLQNVLLTVAGIIATIKAQSIWNFFTKLGTNLISSTGLIAKFSAAFDLAITSGQNGLQAIRSGFEAAAFGASKFQLALGAITAVFSITFMVVRNVNNVIEQNRQKVLTAAQDASRLTDELSELYTKYETLSEAVKTDDSVTDDLISTQDELIDKLGLTKKELNELAGGYDNLSDKIREAYLEKLKIAEIDLIAGYNTSEDKLLSDMFWKPQYIEGQNLNDEERKKAGDAIEALVEAGYAAQVWIGDLEHKNYLPATKNTGAINGFQIWFGQNSLDTSSVEGALELYEALQDMLSILSDQYGDSYVYTQIYDYYNSMKEDIESLKTNIESLNKTRVDEMLARGELNKSVETKTAFDEYRKGLIESAKASGNFVGTEEDIAAAFDEVLSSMPEYSKFLSDTYTQTNSATNATAKYTHTLSELSETIQTLKSNYDLLLTAQKEMVLGTSLSESTIKSLKDAVDEYNETAGATEKVDYLDFLYEENGAIKLNIEAWKKFSNIKSEESIKALKEKISALEEENKQLDEDAKKYDEKINDAYEKANSSTNEYGSTNFNAEGRRGTQNAQIASWISQRNELTGKIEENSAAIEENQKELEIYETLYNNVSGALNSYTEALLNYTSVEDTVVQIQDALTTVADLQKEVGESFVFSLDKALEFSTVYPEILNGATLTADKQIRLNEDVVNSFIESKEAELRAQIDAKIQEIEAEKAVVKAQMEFAQAQVDALESGDSAAEAKITSARIIAQAMIDAGTDEANAYATATAFMQGKSEDFSQAMANAATDMDRNFTDASKQSAENLFNNMKNMVYSIDNVAQAAQNAALAVSGIYSGEVKGNSSTAITGKGGVGTSNVYTVTRNENPDFGDADGSEEFTYTSSMKSTDEYLEELKNDIANYQDAIDQYEGQEALLKAIRESILEDFRSGNKMSSNKSSSTSKDTKDTLKTIDWIEIALSRVERVISRLKTTAESAFKSLATRLGATKDEISAVNDEIVIQQRAYERYMQEANSVGISSALAERVRNGAFDINEYDDATQELISDYQEWYEKALDCSDAVQELHEELASLYEDNFNKIQEDFDSQLSLLEHMTNSYQTGLDLLEARGYLESTKYYSAMSDVENQNISTMEKELENLKQAFSEAMNSGEIEEYSASWYSMQQEINGVKEALAEANVQLAEYAKSMRETEWGYFDFVEERISQITQEADFLIDLLDNSNLYDERGQFNNEGTAAMGLHAQNYNVYMSQADQYAKEILSIDKELAEDPYNTDIIERREELLGLQQDSITAAEDEKAAIVDMVKEGIDIELNALKELIDTYNEALDSEKDLYDYQKKIKDQTSEISSLQKQLSAYENDMSEETRATVQRLKVELQDAQENLQETEYDKFISDQKSLLDQLYSEYEEILNQRLDNVDLLMSDMIDVANEKTDEINQTLTETADKVGYMLTENMQHIWDNSTNAIDGTISKYGDNFTDMLTAIQNVLNSIWANTASMIGESDESAEEVIDNTTATTEPEKPAPKPPATTSTPSNNTTSNEKPISVGGKINAGSALIYDYVGDNSGERQYFASNPIYTVLKEKNGYLQVRWHKLNSGITGWFKKSDVKAYKTGGLIDYTGIAKVDGTPSKPELMLNADDTNNFLELRDALRTVSANPQSVKKLYAGSNIAALGNLFSETNGASRIKPMSKTSNTSFGDIKITIPIENVQNYNDFVTQLRSDKKFEDMIVSMTVGRIAGNNSLSKYKYNWN